MTKRCRSENCNILATELSTLSLWNWSPEKQVTCPRPQRDLDLLTPRLTSFFFFFSLWQLLYSHDSHSEALATCTCAQMTPRHANIPYTWKYLQFTGRTGHVETASLQSNTVLWCHKSRERSSRISYPIWRDSLISTGANPHDESFRSLTPVSTRSPRPCFPRAISTSDDRCSLTAFDKCNKPCISSIKGLRENK